MPSARNDATSRASLAATGMLRVTRERREGSGVVVVEGRLDAATLPLVMVACQEIRAAGLGLVLDLAGLRWLDVAAAEALRAIAATGAELRNANRYVSALLSAGPAGPTPSS